MFFSHLRLKGSWFQSLGATAEKERSPNEVLVEDLFKIYPFIGSKVFEWMMYLD
jgi:hypothetical protein